MKSKSFFVAMLAIVVSHLFPSCTKEQVRGAIQQTIQNSNVTFGFRIAGTYVQLSIGGGQGLYWDQQYYDSYNYNTPWSSITSAGYILNKPTNPEAITIYDRFDRPIGVVRCDQGQGATTNEVFLRIRYWFDQNPNGKCVVPVSYPLIPFTRGGEWSGTISL